jgi:hypothetical protein
MPSTTERPSAAAIVARALLYAAAVLVLVLYGPGADYSFIYQGF